MKIANSSYLAFNQLPKLMFRQILTSKAKQLQNKAFIFPFGYGVLGQLKNGLNVAVSKEKRTGAFPKSGCSITDGCNVPIGATRRKHPMKKYLSAPLCNTQTHPREWRWIESHYKSAMQLPDPWPHWYKETAATFLGSISAFTSQKLNQKSTWEGVACRTAGQYHTSSELVPNDLQGEEPGCTFKIRTM